MKYPFSIFQTQVDDHVFWMAQSHCLNGCVGQGETLDEAFAELEANEIEWMNAAEEFGIPVPEIPVEQLNSYSGKFTVRISPYLHKEAAELAKKNHISMTQYVSDAISAQNSKLLTGTYVLSEFESKFQTMLNKVSDKVKTLFQTETIANIHEASLYTLDFDLFSSIGVDTLPSTKPTRIGQPQ